MNGKKQVSHPFWPVLYVFIPDYEGCSESIETQFIMQKHTYINRFWVNLLRNMLLWQEHTWPNDVSRVIFSSLREMDGRPEWRSLFTNWWPSLNHRNTWKPKHDSSLHLQMLFLTSRRFSCLYDELKAKIDTDLLLCVFTHFLFSMNACKHSTWKS